MLKRKSLKMLSVSLASVAFVVTSLNNKHSKAYAAVTDMTPATTKSQKAQNTITSVENQTPKVSEPKAPQPKSDKLLAEYLKYWKPEKYVKGDISTEYRGNVINKKVLQYNDSVVKQINAKGAQDDAQFYRAGAIDAPYQWQKTVKDGFGSTLGDWFEQGLSEGSLPETTKAMEFATTFTNKAYFNYPRPYLSDRSRGGKNNLQGLAKNLHVIPYDNQNPDYGFSGAFPSGHTTAGYSWNLMMAQIFPEKEADFILRASEAGNNRLVLGVHYPLDIIGGRILGSAGVAYTAALPEQEELIKKARAELENYFIKRGKLTGLGSNMKEILAKLASQGKLNYTNPFTDVISTEPITDHKSGLKVYTQRMTYGFKQLYDSALKPIVPVGATRLLRDTFPTLNTEQLNQVLAKTEIPSGYPLSLSSEGWQRINLFAAATSKVTLDKAGNVIKVEPGQDSPSVVVQSDEEMPMFSTTTVSAQNAKANNVFKKPIESEQALNQVLYAPVINNNVNWKIALRDANGKLTGQYISTDSSWKVLASKMINGQLYYRLGTQDQWVSAQYLSSDTTEIVEFSGVVYVPMLHNNKNWKVLLQNQEGKYTDQYIQTNSLWKVVAVKKINGKVIAYKIGNDSQWLPAIYGNFEQE